MSMRLMSLGFIAAGLMNIGGVLLFSKGLTSEVVVAADPVVMSQFGLLMIMVWGLAYIAITKSWQQVPWLCALFCVEKIIYSAVWIDWQLNGSVSLSAVYEQDALAGVFYSIYGINDIVFAVFFALAFFMALKSKNV